MLQNIGSSEPPRRKTNSTKRVPVPTNQATTFRIPQDETMKMSTIQITIMFAEHGRAMAVCISTLPILRMEARAASFMSLLLLSCLRRTFMDRWSIRLHFIWKFGRMYCIVYHRSGYLYETNNCARYLLNFTRCPCRRTYLPQMLLPRAAYFEAF